MTAAWDFGISQVTTWPWSFEQDVERYGALSADAIEVWEFKLERGRGRRQEQLAGIAAHGLRVSSFQADVHSMFPTRMRPKPHDPRARLEAFAATLAECAPAIPGSVFVLNTGVAQDGNVERAFAQTVAALRELAPRAADLGVRLALEPLHPLAMNEDTFVWTLEEAARIVEAVDHDAFGICADVWNLAGQHDLQRRLTALGDRIFLAQVSDWRRPRSFLDRVGVGDGNLDLRPFLHGVIGAGYAGPLVLEIFSKDVPDSLYDGDLAATVARSREALTRLLGAPPHRPQVQPPTR